MAFLVSEESAGEYEQVPVGTHNAVCYQLVDAGTSMEEYQGEEKKRHSVYIFWELPDLLMADGRPMSISCQYTLSLHESAKLRRHLQSWMNRAFTEEELKSFDMTQMLGTTCKLDVGLTSGGRAKVVGVFAADGGSKKVETANEQTVFDLEDYCLEYSGGSNDASKHACDVLEGLPRYIQWRIAGCDEPGRDPQPPCFEVQAAMTKAQKPTAKKKAAPKKDDPAPDDGAPFDDDIPF